VIAAPKQKDRTMPEVRLERPKVAVSNNPADGQSARSLIIGLGNPFFTDDGVGPLLARRIHEHLGSPDVDLAELAAGGVELMETMVGYGRAVIIDAILTGKGAPGSCYLLDLDHCPPTRHANMSHEIGLLEGLELGRRLGLLVPDSIRIYAIEVVDPLTFGTAMSDEVKREIPRIALQIASEIGRELCDSSPGRCNRPIDDAKGAGRAVFEVAGGV
jgi:hydrogenase maturation protease